MGLRGCVWAGQSFLSHDKGQIKLLIEFFSNSHSSWRGVMGNVGVGGSWRGVTGHVGVGWGGSWRGVMGHVGVGGSWRGGVGHVGLGWVGSWRGGMGHEGVRWVM